MLRPFFKSFIYFSIALIFPFAGTNKLNAPTKVNVNTYLRSIDKIDDYKMVFVVVFMEPNLLNFTMCFQEYSVQLTFRQSWLDPRLSYPNHDGKWLQL